jgi:C4-dicarboxylate transporter, DctM subunit
VELLFTIAIIVLISLAFLFSGMPLAFALGSSSVVICFLFGIPDQINFMADIFYSCLDSFELLAVPLFIYMGNLIGSSRSGNDLYEAVHRWVYKLPGGLVISNIFACAIFSAMCGVSAATAAAIGASGIPQMIKRGVKPSLATGSIVAGGTLGILIPPSVTMIVYGIVTETSIGKLFIGGIIPGIMISLMFAGWAVISSYKYKKDTEFREDNLEKREYYSFKDKIQLLPKVIPFIVIIVTIMYVLYGGLATPSEAGGVGSIVAFILIVLLYKVFTLREHAQILKTTINESTMILMLIAASYLFGAVLTKLYVTQTITNIIISLPLSRWVLMVIINIMLLLLGTLIPPVAIILIVSPILLPILLSLGFDPVWFGVLMTLNMEVGLITPPVGVNLYIVQGIAPDVPLSEVLKGTIPFVIILLLGLIILSIFPELVLWLPSKMII